MSHYSRINEKQEKLKNELYKDIKSLPPFNNGFTPDVPLKIKKIDKNYKKYNSIVVKKVIGQGALILFITFLIFKPEAWISQLVTDHLNNMFTSIIQTGKFTQDQAAAATYASSIDGVVPIISKCAEGLALAIAAVNYICHTLPDCKKSRLIKAKIEEIKAKFQNNKRI